MSIPKHGKRDSNERAIIDALENAGATVIQLSMTNVPDLLVGFRGENFLFETKQKKGKLRIGQAYWVENWQGKPVEIVHTSEEALRAIDAI